MMKKNKDIFLAGADVLVYLAEAMHKKYSSTSVLGHLFSTYVSYDRFFNPLLLYVPVHILDVLLYSSSWVRTKRMTYFSTKKQISTF